MRISKRQLRVDIAKDAIKQINAGRYLAETGTYAELNNVPFEDSTPQTSVQTLINKDNIECKVCALGACFMSLVNLKNKVNLREFNNYHGMSSHYIKQHKVYNKLASIFPPSMMTKIESAFECSVMKNTKDKTKYKVIYKVIKTKVTEHLYNDNYVYTVKCYPAIEKYVRWGLQDRLEDDEDYGYDFFKPDYNNEANVKNIVPLPPNMKTNLYEYLNEILFNHVSDADVISKYAVDLGCQKEKLKECFIPAPVQTSSTERGVKAFNETIDFFNIITSGNGSNLLPENCH